MAKPLYDRLIEAGYPKEDVFHHESDLYVFDTELTRRIIAEWFAETFQKPYEEGWDVLTFRDSVTKERMFDVPFQYPLGREASE